MGASVAVITVSVSPVVVVSQNDLEIVMQGGGIFFAKVLASPFPQLTHAPLKG